MENKMVCLECGDILRGRIDKKFCNETCRNQFHNRLNVEEGRVMREINNGLRRNRKILFELMESGKRTIQRSSLVSRGFDFELITAVREKRTGNPCFLCYDLGYIPLDENRFQVVRLMEN